jgi:uncharacterized membrane protein
MSPLVYQILHVTSVVLLAGFTFQACAAPVPEQRRFYMSITGVFSLVALVAGFGLAAKLGYGFPGWMILKLVCWLGLSGLAGMAFRQPGRGRALSWVAALLVLVAVVSVYAKPF